MKKSPIIVKSRQFAVKIVLLYRHLSEESKEFVLSRQMLRSGTSIGANVAEADGAFGKKDFIAKMTIAHKECLETLYWLELLSETGYLSRESFTPVHEDCLELKRLLVSIIKTARLNEGLEP